MKALLVSLLLLSSAQAWVITDPGGDLTASGQAAPHDAGADMLSLEIIESEDGLEFILTTSSRSPAPVWAVDYMQYEIRFTFEDTGYLLSLGLITPLGTPGESQTRGFFENLETGQSTDVKPLATDDSLSAIIEKKQILNGNGVKFTSGRQLEDIFVESMQGTITDLDGETHNTGEDRMPDQGMELFVAELGPVIHPDLVLDAPEPIRWSNGGASTYAFEVNVNAKKHATFHIENAPDGWNIFPPAPVHGEETVTVFVQTPDRHIHDGHEEFLLVATSGDVRSEIALGMYYPPIAMPAGHHPTLYFHEWQGSMPPEVKLTFGTLFYALGENVENAPFMNTEPDAEPFSIEARGLRSDFMDSVSVWGWTVPLSPTLRIGLNLTDGAPESKFSFEAPAAMDTGRIGGQLVLWKSWNNAGQGFNGTVLSHFKTDVRNIDGVLEPEWSPWGAQVIPYDPEWKLGLNLFYAPEADVFQAVGPLGRPTLTGGSMHLPLGEYHDDVTIPLTEAQQEAAQTVGEETPEVEETPFMPVAIVALLVSCLRRLRN